jgi:iron complex transport system permease protein
MRWGLLALALVTVGLLSLLVGRYPAPYWSPPTLIHQDELARRIVLNLRLPRLVAALLTGASLAGAGIVLQTVFRNPIVEPGFLGISQGAAFGAALGIIVLRPGPLGIELTATAFALIGLGLSYLLAERLRIGDWVLRLVLAGIAVSALFSAGVGLLKYLADPLTQLPEITFWLLGGLWNVTWREALFMLPPVALGLAVMFVGRWRLNLLTLSDATAFSLGSRVRWERGVILFGAVLATAAVTAVGGVVGWVGLITPHLARRLFGANIQHALPAAMLVGGPFVAICDDLARSLLPGEIPLGILTSFFGALAFSGLMMRRAGPHS